MISTGSQTSGDRRTLRRAWAVTLAASLAYTAASWAVPALGTATPPAGTRGIFEVAAFFLVAVAALMLAIAGDDDSRPARNAFITGLAVIALTNAVFGVALTVGVGELMSHEGLAFYPWLTSRYLAGALFVVAGLERPRASLGRYLLTALAALALIDGVLLANADSLPQLVAVSGAPATIRATDVVALAVLEGIPALLFIVGAAMAGRLYLRSGAPVFLLLSLALTTQVFTQIHQVARPAFLGPVLTSADAFRGACFALLFVGALLQLRVVFQERAATVRAQEEDLLAHDVLTEELVRVLDREEDFRAIVSHELATPVATIRAFTHVLAGALRGGSASTREALEGIRAETRRLAELIDRIDELRELEHDDLRCDLRPTRIGPSIDEAARFARGLPGSHPTTVHYDDVRLSIDPVRLGQALRNILANAARYAPPSTPIDITGEVADGTYRITVSDRGPGVPEGERSGVMRRYARGSAGKDTTGAGVGLYVASRIAAAHGGTVTIGDVDGGGARVTIELPAGTALPGTG